jgi:hypothetical protein
MSDAEEDLEQYYCGACETNPAELEDRIEKLEASLAAANALLEGLDDLLEQTMTNTPHPPSYRDWKEGSANIRAFFARAQPRRPAP